MIAAILGWIGSFFGGFFSWLGAFFTACATWIFNFFVYIVAQLIYSLLVAVQAIVLAFIGLANAAIALLPACNVSTIDTTPFLQTYNGAGSTLSSAVCWLLPISFLVTTLLCAVNAVMAYFAISWALRWLKVIK